MLTGTGGFTRSVYGKRLPFIVQYTKHFCYLYYISPVLDKRSVIVLHKLAIIVLCKLAGSLPRHRTSLMCSLHNWVVSIVRHEYVPRTVSSFSERSWYWLTRHIFVDFFSLGHTYVLNQGTEVIVYIQDEGDRPINVVWITECVWLKGVPREIMDPLFGISLIL